MQRYSEFFKIQNFGSIYVEILASCDFIRNSVELANKIYNMWLFLILCCRIDAKRFRSEKK